MYIFVRLACGCIYRYSYLCVYLSKDESTPVYSSLDSTRLVSSRNTRQANHNNDTTTTTTTTTTTINTTTNTTNNTTTNTTTNNNDV